MNCRICGSDKTVLEVTAREMMIPTWEEFTYFECGECNCLQIKDVPENISDYYGPDYYSFDNTDEVDFNAKIESMSPVLDVGSGAGKFLKNLRTLGYGNLTGCDPYIPEDISYGDSIHIYKRTIHQMEGCFEEIFMNDSFEHVPDPHEVMESLRRLLSPNGIVCIKLPVYPNIAFDMFAGNWYQMDAPRHFFLHSTASMEILAREHGLSIIKIEYDSNSSQIYRSYLYAKNIPFWEQKMDMIKESLGISEMENILNLTNEANNNSYGDHAVFYLSHKS